MHEYYLAVLLFDCFTFSLLTCKGKTRHIYLCLLSFSLFSTVPRVACIGQGEVALFSRLFEARPSDPLRREIFRQQPVGTSWFSPSTVPSVAPLAIPPGKQDPVGPLPVTCKRRKRR